jgi:guanine nucleotide-binding protein subunit alpha
MSLFFTYTHIKQSHIDKLLAYKVSGNPKSQLSPEFIALSKLVWQDPITHMLVDKQDRGFYLMDSAP